MMMKGNIMEKTKYGVEIDVCGDCPLGDFLAGLEGVQIRSFEASGPGGGNPCLTLVFSTYQDAHDYLVKHDYDLECHDIFETL